jgi:N-acyl-D-aspartate/D-glutamate deacylase
MQPTQQSFDIVIKGGTIYDGTLTKPYAADIGIQNDKIAAIGELSGKTKKTIDARGLAVMPGLIDVHTHCDLTFKKMGLKRYLAYVMPTWKGNYNYLYQGVTTVVTGNCGYGYSDTEHWHDIINSVKFGTNVYQLVPHGMIREELFGSNQPGELNAKQLDALKMRVAEEMEKGAIGMSTGLAYAPGYLASTG